MPVALPDPQTRRRCGGCGNLTRFDVTRSRRTTEFWHFDLAGDHEVEDVQTEQETVESVTCRWCGRSDAIELVTRAEAGSADAPRPRTVGRSCQPPEDDFPRRTT